jgi:hypothetical protein
MVQMQLSLASSPAREADGLEQHRRLRHGSLKKLLSV